MLKVDGVVCFDKFVEFMDLLVVSEIKNVVIMICKDNGK